MQRRRCAAMLRHRGCNDDAAHNDHIPRPDHTHRTVSFKTARITDRKGPSASITYRFPGDPAKITVPTLLIQAEWDRDLCLVQEGLNGLEQLKPVLLHDDRVRGRG